MEYSFFEMEMNARRTLGVPDDSSIEDIQKAFRQLAKKHHPDHNPGDIKSLNKFRVELDAYRFLTGKSDSFTFIPKGNNEPEMKAGEYADNDWGNYCRYVENFMLELLGINQYNHKKRISQ